MKALTTIGLGGALRFLLGKAFSFLLDICILPQIRVVLLRMLGAKVGRQCIIHDTRFINLHRGTFRNLEIGDECFVGEECLLDVAAPIRLGNQVTLAPRVTVLTHLNVGYADHPLQAAYPPSQEAVDIADGVFVGAASTILSGVKIGRGCLVAAGAVVTTSTPDHALIAGVPAGTKRQIGSGRSEQEETPPAVS